MSRPLTPKSTFVPSVPLLFPFLIFNRLRKLDTPRAPSLDKKLTIDIERKERFGDSRTNSDHSVSPHKIKTSLNKRLYIEVKCELVCSLVMLAEPDMDQRRQNCTYSGALPKATYHVYCMTNMLSWMCRGQVSVGQRPKTAERLDGGR
jgi:hypothetical protein